MRRAGILIVSHIALVVTAVPAAAAPAAHTAREAVSALRKQIDAGQVKRVNLYTDRRVIHASLADKRRFSVRFTAADRRPLVAAMRAHQVRLHIVKHAKRTTHGLRLRYVILIAAAGLGLLAGLGYALVRRRRRR